MLDFDGGEVEPLSAGAAGALGDAEGSDCCLSASTGLSLLGAAGIAGAGVLGTGWDLGRRLIYCPALTTPLTFTIPLTPTSPFTNRYPSAGVLPVASERPIFAYTCGG